MDYFQLRDTCACCSITNQSEALMGVCLELQRQQVVVRASAAKPKCPGISEVPKKSWAPCHKSHEIKAKIHAGGFLFLLFSWSLQHTLVTFVGSSVKNVMRLNFLCLAEAESPKEAQEQFQELEVRHGTKYLQVLGLKWTCISKRAWVSLQTSHICRRCGIQLSPHVLLYYDQYMSCTAMKFSTASPYLQSEAHSKVHRKAFLSRSHRAGWVLGWRKGRLSSHCTPHLARHIHFHTNNSYCSHHWADRLVSDRQRNTVRMVNVA